MKRKPLKRHRTLKTVAGLLSLAVLAACASEAPATGAADTPGVSDDTIRLGQLTILTGPVAFVGQSISQGEKTYWDAVNAEGGVAGKYKVELVSADTAYDPAKAVQQYNAVKKDVAFFEQVSGTSIIQALLPQIKRDRVLVLPSSQDSDWLKEPNLMPVGDTSQIQAINAVNWYVSDGGGSTSDKVCYTGQDDALGEAGAAGFEYGLERLGMTAAADVRYKATDQNLTAPVQKLKSAGCDAVVVNSSTATSGKVFGAAAAARFTPTWLILTTAYSPTFLGTPLEDYLKKDAYVFQSGAQWGDTSVPGMKRMLGDIEKHGPKDLNPSFYFTFGYNQAWAAHKLIEKAVELGDLSREGFLKALESLETVSFEGLSGDFVYGPPEKRNSPRVTSIFTIDAEIPQGLKIHEQDYTSEAAKTFSFS